MTSLIPSLKTDVCMMMMHHHLVSLAALLEFQHCFQNPSLNIIHLYVYFRENDGVPDFPIRQNVLHSFPLPSKAGRNNMAGLNLETLAQSFSAVARRFRATPISVYTNPLCLLSLERHYSALPSLPFLTQKLLSAPLGVLSSNLRYPDQRPQRYFTPHLVTEIN